MIHLPETALRQYEKITRYNSPYTAHDAGRAIDLYPGDRSAHSPVAGRVIDIQTTQAPDKPYAADTDQLILIDTADAPQPVVIDDEIAAVARLLHVDPDVTIGEYIGVGDRIGHLIRSGYFAPWVKPHIHLGFRRPEQNHYRAQGSLPVHLGVDIEPVDWSGRGVVRETGETYAELDRPQGPTSSFAGIATDEGTVALDGGLPHFQRGGAFGDATGTVKLLGTKIGTTTDSGIDWEPITVIANGRPIKGLSLFAGRGRSTGVRLICPEEQFDKGTEVAIELRPGNQTN